MSGVLAGLRIIELAGIGPAPFCGMMLADQGAEVIRIERPGASSTGNVLHRSRKFLTVDLKTSEGVRVVRDLCAGADAVIEGFRPGVMERLELGPKELLALNSRLVYGRMTGWGQSGPLAAAAGHDINYIALAGALHPLGRAGEKPTPPINMLGDFGGGGMLLAFGMVSALLHAARTGQGQVVDCAIVDGAAIQMSMVWSLRAAGRWSDERGTNLLDTGAHFYETYRTADGKYVAIGAIEPQFYALLREKLGIADDTDFDQQMSPSKWPLLKQRLQALFATRTRDEWCAILEGTDACFAPVLDMAEAPTHPHSVAREAFIDIAGITQPAPAPRFSATPAGTPAMNPPSQAGTRALLSKLGYGAEKIDDLCARGIVA
jgi:Predicted acyl-CoA transferases/carnitine dehydratase